MKIEHRIEWNYAGAQSSFWIGHCALTGYTAVLLSSRGFNNVQVGFTSSLMAVLTIVFQLIISNFSDHNPHIAIKKTITALYLLAMATSGMLLSNNIPIALMMTSFALSSAFNATIIGLFNALVMQYINANIPVRIGWPRGIGSVVYATCAYVLGRAIELYFPGILVPIFLCTTLFSIVLVLLMPDINRLTARSIPAFQQDHRAVRITYRQMLTGNTPLMLFLLAGLVLYIGQTTAILFLVRVVESRGGGTTELGISMFLQAGVEMPTLFLTPWILRRYKSSNVLVFAFFAYVFKTFLLFVSTSISMVYLAMSMNMFSYGIYCICSVYFVNSLVRPGERVRAQGLVSLCSSAGGILGNMLAGAVLDAWGIQILLFINTLITLFSAIIMMFCAKASQDFVPSPLPN